MLLLSNKIKWLSFVPNITYNWETPQPTYYPQGNGLAESSNKSLMRIIKKLLQDNKKAWHTNLIHAYERIEIVAFKGKNAYVLDEMEGGLVFGAPVNGRLLKHYFL